jgi:hypothetical protein
MSATHPSRPDTPNLTLPEQKLDILTKLNIPLSLADRSDRGLVFAYQKYKGYLQATQNYQQQVADGLWDGPKLTSVDLTELFVSKSFFHSHYKKFFPKVTNYPLLLDWLENTPNDRPSDKKVWGEDKSVYTFKDLKVFFEKGQGKGKGKKKVQEANSDKEEGSSRKTGLKKKKKQVK